MSEALIIGELQRGTIRPILSISPPRRLRTPSGRRASRIVTHSLPAIFPGSWIASGLRHRLSRDDNSRTSPQRRAVSTSNVAPACDTSDAPPAITGSQGRRPVSFTREVPLNSLGHGLSNHDQTALSRHFRAFTGRVSLTRSAAMKARG